MIHADTLPLDITFAILSVIMIGSAIRVVTTKNVVHAALYLVVVLAGAAAQYILLVAEFVAWVQVLIYIGAIVILFLFGIMLTRAPMKPDGPRCNAATSCRRRRSAASRWSNSAMRGARGRASRSTSSHAAARAPS